MDINKLIELQLNSINNILAYCVNLLSKNKNEIISNDSIKLIGKLLSVPLESNMSLL